MVLIARDSRRVSRAGSDPSPPPAWGQWAPGAAGAGRHPQHPARSRSTNTQPSSHRAAGTELQHGPGRAEQPPGKVQAVVVGGGPGELPGYGAGYGAAALREAATPHSVQEEGAGTPTGRCGACPAGGCRGGGRPLSPACRAVSPEPQNPGEGGQRGKSCAESGREAAPSDGKCRSGRRYTRRRAPCRPQPRWEAQNTTGVTVATTRVRLRHAAGRYCARAERESFPPPDVTSSRGDGGSEAGWRPAARRRADRSCRLRRLLPLLRRVWAGGCGQRTVSLPTGTTSAGRCGRWTRAWAGSSGAGPAGSSLCVFQEPAGERGAVRRRSVGRSQPGGHRPDGPTARGVAAVSGGAGLCHGGALCGRGSGWAASVGTRRSRWGLSSSGRSAGLCQRET